MLPNAIEQVLNILTPLVVKNGKVLFARRYSVISECWLGKLMVTLGLVVAHGRSLLLWLIDVKGLCYLSRTTSRYCVSRPCKGLLSANLMHHVIRVLLRISTQLRGALLV